MAKFLIILLFFPTTAFAADPWTTQDTVLEGVYLGLLAIDCGQTIYRKQTFDTFQERNPLLRDASTDVFRATCLTLAILRPLFALWLDQPLRQMFQMTSIVIELYVVTENARIRPNIAWKLSF